jgi:hypothetical protein
MCLNFPFLSSDLASGAMDDAVADHMSTMELFEANVTASPPQEKHNSSPVRRLNEAMYRPLEYTDRSESPMMRRQPRKVYEPVFVVEGNVRESNITLVWKEMHGYDGELSESYDDVITSAAIGVKIAFFDAKQFTNNNKADDARSFNVSFNVSGQIALLSSSPPRCMTKTTYWGIKQDEPPPSLHEQKESLVRAIVAEFGQYALD